MKVSIGKKAEHSRRYAWIAEHRGGPLSLSDRQQLIRWARECIEHVLFLTEGQADSRILDALNTAKTWEASGVSTGTCMKASLAAHAAARLSSNEIHKNISRGAGQAVATAHMADHSLGGAFYALKAIKIANGNVLAEKQWQEEKLSALPVRLQTLIRDTWQEKKLDQRI
ncbi:hypothetical protein C7T94_11300 [Pedobacter yulinensis]|uniref:Imm-5-like domain-containing protein n=1 Tax=Pedobacter yulinensis TaxID=2126353 RepID=A0A2T3HL34_9SPHI|nr:hypothetical protein [Pedobacter yulinensis]PST83178.1 hypothetical protein C7T94_11300 [Pedobacter yulinensis]